MYRSQHNKYVCMYAYIENKNIVVQNGERKINWSSTLHDTLCMENCIFIAILMSKMNK